MEKDFFRNCLKKFRKSSICGLSLSVDETVVDGTLAVVLLAVVVGWMKDAEEEALTGLRRFFFFFIVFFIVLTTF